MRLLAAFSLALLVGCDLVSGIAALEVTGGGGVGGASGGASGMGAAGGHGGGAGGQPGGGGQGGGSGGCPTWTSFGGIGGTHPCVIGADGEVRCWGSNQDGELGTGQMGFSAVPVAPSGLPPAAGVFGRDAVFGLTKSGSFWVWGKNDGMYGDGTMTASPVPIPLDYGLGGAGVRSVASTFGVSCLVDLNGLVYCSGADDNGIVTPGVRKTKNIVNPLLIEALGGDNEEVALGGNGACVRKTNGDVWCWGHDNAGELASPIVGLVYTPFKVEGISGAVPRSLGLAGGNGCVMMGQNEIYCWGYPYLFSSTGGPTPERLDLPIGPLVEYSFAPTHLCGRDASGAVACAGTNVEGQLGSNDSSTQLNIVTLPAPAVAVAAFNYTSCAILDDNRVMCWGSNFNGQLGRGLTEEQLLASEIPEEVLLCP